MLGILNINGGECVFPSIKNIAEQFDRMVFFIQKWPSAAEANDHLNFCFTSLP